MSVAVNGPEVDSFPLMHRTGVPLGFRCLHRGPHKGQMTSRTPDDLQDTSRAPLLLGKVSGHCGAGARQVDHTTTLWGNKNWSIRRCKHQAIYFYATVISPRLKSDLN